MGEVIPIAEVEDPRVADYRSVRERDLIGRAGRFLVESELVLRVLVASRFAVCSVLLLDRLVPRLAPLVPDGVPVYTGDQALLSALTGFHLHRGVLACAECGPPLDAEALAAGARRLVILEGITNHDNVGGIFRNAAAFGVDAVLLDGVTCHPLYRKATRVALGGTLKVPFARVPSVPALLARLGAAGWQTLALTPARDATPLHEVAAAPRTALCLGAEGEGLLAATQQAATRRVTIPMAAGFDSLNVATASGIALYALFAAE
jgi:tRNA G18 (ribose-2'-O)-methylase SpoU